MQIVDNFMFNNDAELLELRYHVLKDVVDYFVISEANHTFTGIPKSYNGNRLIKELGLDESKFIVLEVDTSEHTLRPNTMDHYEAELIKNPNSLLNYTRLRKQKDAILSILDRFPNDTIFMHGDVDEIPKPESVKYLAYVSSLHENNILKIPLVLLESSADKRVYDEFNLPVEWARSYLFCTKKQLQSKGFAALRTEYENPYAPITITQDGKIVQDLGWHFTWMGDVQRKKLKAQSCLHADAIHLVNNVTEETKKIMSVEVNEKFGELVKYHHKDYDLSQLPKEIFHLPRVKKFLLPNHKPIKVVDYTMYFNEIELFELRYHVLKDVVDLFVVSEADVTFFGNKKDFTLEKHLDRLKIDKNKVRIIKNKLHDNVSNKDILPIDEINSTRANDKASVLSWVRERLQRDALKSIIKEFDDDCVFIVSDVDEIISGNHVPYLSRITKENPDKIIKIPLVLLEGSANRRLTDNNGKLISWDRSMYFCSGVQLKSMTANTIRAGMQEKYPTVYIAENGKRVEDLGWHFTWMGDLSRKKIKAENYGHANNLDIVDTLSTSTAEILANELLKPINLQKKYKYVTYDTNLLPKVIDNLPHIYNFLLGDVDSNIKLDNEKLNNFLDDPQNPLTNFYLGYDYDLNGQTASAVSYYLRAAERTTDTNIQYESLLRIAKCFERQKNRNFTVSGLYTRAITVDPHRPEAYFLFAEFYYNTKDWQNCYLYTTLGLSLTTKHKEKTLTNIGYDGIIGLEYYKAVSGWYVGFYKQSKELIQKIQTTNELAIKYKNLLEVDIKAISK